MRENRDIVRIRPKQLRDQLDLRLVGHASISDNTAPLDQCRPLIGRDVGNPHGRLRDSLDDFLSPPEPALSSSDVSASQLSTRMITVLATNKSSVSLDASFRRSSGDSLD